MSAELPARFDAGLRARSRSSIGWTITRFLSDQLFSFVVFVILARLLTQADIGAFAVMAVTAEAFRIIATAGLVQTIARKKELSPAFLDTIYRSQQAFSFISAFLIMILAQPIADFRMHRQQINAPGNGDRGAFVTSEEEGHHLVAYLIGGQPSAILSARTLQQPK